MEAGAPEILIGSDLPVLREKLPVREPIVREASQRLASGICLPMSNRPSEGLTVPWLP